MALNSKEVVYEPSSGGNRAFPTVLVSWKSSSHHASNPIITYDLRVNSQELDYQNDKIIITMAMK